MIRPQEFFPHGQRPLIIAPGLRVVAPVIINIAEVGQSRGDSNALRLGRLLEDAQSFLERLFRFEIVALLEIKNPKLAERIRYSRMLRPERLLLNLERALPERLRA